MSEEIKPDWKGAVLNWNTPAWERDFQARRQRESIQIVRIGEDPHGRNEPTVFYHDRSIHPTDVFYLWVKFWPEDWPPLPKTSD